MILTVNIVFYQLFYNYTQHLVDHHGPGKEDDKKSEGKVEGDDSFDYSATNT